MNQEKINMINTYIKTNISPILVEGITGQNLPNSVIIPSNCAVELLNGHYEGVDFMPPKWYEELMIKKDLNINILVIDNLTNIGADDQVKFCEILKYRKISTFELPKNCAIVITCDKVDKNKISPEIYSLVAHI